MAASEKTLIYQEGSHSFKNFLSKRDMRLIAAQEESNYVDINDLLELKFDDTKTVKVTFENSGPLAIIKDIGGMSDSQGEHKPCTEKVNESTEHECTMKECVEKSSSFETAAFEIHKVDKNDTECTEETEQEPKSRNLETQSTGSNNHEQYNDVYMSSRSESDDEVTVVLSDQCTPEIREDESHYITTHEIQLLELDHDTDYDFETGSSWDIEDDLQVYSFVDYASFDSDETIGAKESKQANANEAVDSSKPESNLCDADKCASSDEGLSKKQKKAAGQIHLSIKATSRAVNEPGNIQEHAKGISRYVLRGVDARGDNVCDNAKCFIAVPGRLHFGSKLKCKDVNDYSSGASSAMSELDDADKEVRNLTARAFKSLAYPYFDAINFSTSSESSASEHGLGINRWSTFVDLKYGKARDQNLAAHKGSTSNFHFAKKRDGKEITGLTLTSMRAPPVEIFALNGSLMSRKNASTTTKKAELMGKFSQGQSNLIRLTETLNFRCNVKSGQPVNESTGGSRSTDEVTNTLPSAQVSEASKQLCNAEETMEDTHKKAIFASSLLKNVISKKMQFEQERKMERGEICEAHHAPSPCLGTHEAHREKTAKKNSKGLQRQSSKFSEADSDFTIVCVDDLGDIVDGNSSDAKDDGRKEEPLTSASETNLESANDTKKGAFEASKSTLLRSQNSAFRSWRDGELEFQKEHKNDKTPEEKPLRECPGETSFSVDSASGKHTKMSHLFVPSIQLPSADRDLRKPPPSGNTSARDQALKWRSDTLYVSDATRSAVTAKSPEIKISLRSVRDNKSDPFNIAKLLTPNLGCKTAEDNRCQALAVAFKGESSDKVPHFIVRDIRDNKGKLQTPIHQVRDVRKLVKSSYHFVALDNDNKSSHSTCDGEHKTLKQSPYLNSASLSPIVIKCQSVNTNSNVKQSGNLIDPPKRRFPEDMVETDRSSPHVAVANRLPKQEVPAGVRIETSTQKQDKSSDTAEKKGEPKMANQAALEKLQAAVKTMEQLYVFDKNEWKRKTEPRPIMDSHVLSLITNEKHSVDEQESTSSSTPAARLLRQNSNSNLNEMPPQKDDKSSSTPIAREDQKGPRPLMQLTAMPCKNISQKPLATKTLQTHVASPATLSSKGVPPKSQKIPVSLKITQPKRVLEERERPNGSETEFAPLQFTSTADSENYLTIPVKPQATPAIKPTMSGLGKTAVYTIPTGGGKAQTASPPSYLIHSDTRGHPSPKRSSFVMETRSPDTPSAAIYHTPLPVPMQAAQPQFICFSPTVQPSPIPTDHFQATQRKMLLDPTTGNYYLVDTPVQPSTRRFFDPETGQFVDVPMPQQPPMTPVPMPISPLALGPGAYGHTYMFYPGYMPTAMIPARTIPSQLSMQSEADDGDKSHSHMGQQEDGAYMESPYYMPSGKLSQTTSMAQHVKSSRLANSKQPVISITSQQGPRIIAPPSFDGTTMSFVVEHR
ncbi:uncharacterized protein C4orf54 homolog [Carassius gibelio]|uniref:uncharacterized protein C4orf54 homolog n=1 Tax=Carassius gibelio TaxID=101364 RepID=UPI002279A051|nr:uncharacterized protein C4orf54 homolog [Carassius gibelio]